MSAIPIPQTRPRLFLLGLILVDLPVLAAIGVLGWFYGFEHTYTVIMDWRMAHPWSLIPSIAVAALLVKKVVR